jgi:hypothetical protein
MGTPCNCSLPPLAENTMLVGGSSASGTNYGAGPAGSGRSVAGAKMAMHVWGHYFVAHQLTDSYAVTVADFYPALATATAAVAVRNWHGPSAACANNTVVTQGEDTTTTPNPDRCATITSVAPARLDDVGGHPTPTVCPTVSVHNRQCAQPSVCPTVSRLLLHFAVSWDVVFGRRIHSAPLPT